MVQFTFVVSRILVAAVSSIHIALTDWQAIIITRLPRTVFA